MGAPEAKAIMRADNRKLKGDLAKSQKMFGRTFGRIGKGIKSKLSGAVGGIAALGATVGIASIAKDVLDFEETLTRLGIQSGVTGKEFAELRDNMIGMSRATGISRGELAGAATSIVNLGGASSFSVEKLEVLAKTSKATGTSMDDLAKLAFVLDKSFDLSNPEDLQAALGGIVQAGKEGSIPLNALATTLQQIGGTFADTASEGKRGAAELTAALQVLGGQGFATAAEAGTGLTSLISEFAAKKKQLGAKGIGIQVFEKGEQRDFVDILDDIRRAKLSEEQLAGIFKKKEGRKALLALLSETGTQGFKDFMDAGLNATDVIDQDFQRFQTSTAGRLAKSMNALKENIAKIFTPERIENFVKAMGKIADFAGFMVDHIKEFALIFATIKIASFAASMSGIAGQTAAAAKGATGLAGAMGKASAAAGAFTGGFALGTFLDDVTGASDSIAKIALNDVNFSKSGFLRERAADIGQEQKRGAFSLGSEKVFQKLGGGKDPEEVLRDAKALIRAATAAGVVEGGVGGKKSLVQAARVTQKGTLLPQQAAGIERRGESTEAGETLLSAVKTAERLILQATLQQARGIKVEITVDQKGALQVVGKARTGGQE